VFIHGKPFQPSLLYVGKVRSLPFLKNLSDAPHQGRLLALPINNGVGWKGLPGTNTLAYYENS
jgi:hypothetical protein